MASIMSPRVSSMNSLTLAVAFWLYSLMASSTPSFTAWPYSLYLPVSGASSPILGASDTAGTGRRRLPELRQECGRLIGLRRAGILFNQVLEDLLSVLGVLGLQLHPAQPEPNAGAISDEEYFL